MICSKFYIYGYSDKGRKSNNTSIVLAGDKIIFNEKNENYAYTPFFTAVCQNQNQESAQTGLKKLSEFKNFRDDINDDSNLSVLEVEGDNSAYCFTIGNCRMYRYANGKIGLMSSDKTKESPIKLGETDDEVIIIMTDGVSNFISKGEFEVAMKMDLPLNRKIDAIARLAVNNGSDDNISIAAVKFISKEDIPQKESETNKPNENNSDDSSIAEILDVNVKNIVNKDEKANRLVSNIFSLTGDLMAQAKSSLEDLKKKYK